mmetsp:Transcript_102415/g.330360  ORF Transcript_102415/g.330360 Transcript_102415/m.330360 type:complete len:361 (-) Transcript_102415:81-1163(-)
MGAVESRVGSVLHWLLEPKEAPAWVAGSGGRTTFPPAPPGSLLLLGHVGFAVPDVEAARRFCVECLGGQEQPRKETQAQKEVRIGAASSPTATSTRSTCSSSVAPRRWTSPAGASEIRLLPAADAAAAAWPGHLYVWVADIQRTLEGCRALEKQLGVELVQEVHHITSSDAVDALLLRDPCQLNSFVVNQAPKGLAARIRTIGGASAAPAEGAARPNLLGVIEAVHTVPAGVAVSLARFYSHFLSAAVTQKQGGWAVHFSLGKALRQTLLFAEAEEAAPEPQAAELPEVCVYLPSAEDFEAAFQRCSEAGLLQGTWEKAQKTCEFRFQRCQDPETGSAALELKHVVRSPEHPDCPRCPGE